MKSTKSPSRRPAARPVSVQSFCRAHGTEAIVVKRPVDDARWVATHIYGRPKSWRSFLYYAYGMDLWWTSQWTSPEDTFCWSSVAGNGATSGAAVRDLARQLNRAHTLYVDGKPVEKARFKV
jgi:hypothetical protein